MKILIDGDSCSKLNTIETIAKEHNIPCHIFCDTKRIIESDYSEIHIIDCGTDAVDFALVNKCQKNDIVITKDSGLAALALSRNAFALNCYGQEYTKNNIMTYLNSRHIRSTESHKTNRKQVKGTLKTANNNIPFYVTLNNIITKGNK